MRNRQGQQVTTAVTNLDIHDISRTARTFGIQRYFMVTPIAMQHELVGRILAHWNSDSSREYHPDRCEAVSRVRMVHSFEDLKTEIRSMHGEDPEVILTDARAIPGLKAVSYEGLRQELKDPSRSRPAVVVFGTGWGVSDAFYPEVQRVLAPVHGPEGESGYNHLSVRSAAAIILDRLFGDR